LKKIVIYIARYTRSKKLESIVSILMDGFSFYQKKNTNGGIKKKGLKSSQVRLSKGPSVCYGYQKGALMWLNLEKNLD